MPVGLLIQTRATAEHLSALLFGNPRAVIFHAQGKAVRPFDHTQAHLGIGPFAGVVEQVAEQFEQILAVPRQLQARRCDVTQGQMLAVNHVQRRQQPRQLGIAIEQRAGQRIPG